MGSNAGNYDVYCGSELLDQSEISLSVKNNLENGPTTDVLTPISNILDQQSNRLNVLNLGFDLTVNSPCISDFTSPVLSNDNLDVGSSTPGIVDISTPKSSPNHGRINHNLSNTTPCNNNISTPNSSMLDESSDLSTTNSDTTHSSEAHPPVLDNELQRQSATEILKKIRIKNINRITIATLNINFFAPKFEQLKAVIGKNLDILVFQETKLDSTFPEDQFIIDGYSPPYRLDRNKHGGGVIIYVREDIPSKKLTKHNFTKNVEGLFIEINLRKTKLLLFGSYRSDNPKFGIKPVDFFEQVGLALDTYSNYDKFLLAGDFNVDEKEDILQEFLAEHNARNLVKDKTCFKNLDNQSCIDLFLTNCNLSFQNTTAFVSGLSDVHRMVVTVFKTTFPKAPPKIIEYRNYKQFIQADFQYELKEKLMSEEEIDYSNFERIFLEVLNKHAPIKKKTVRANDKPFMTKALRKAIMRRSALKNKYVNMKTEETEKAFKKQKNYTNKLLWKEKKKYFSNLDLNKITDNKKFWNTIKPFFSNGSSKSSKITLVEDDEIITEDKKIAEKFNDYFIDAVSALDIQKIVH